MWTLFAISGAIAVDRYLAFRASGAEVFRVQQNGYVGIGTAAPLSTLSMGDGTGEAAAAYLQIDSKGAAPAAGDCDAAGEATRMIWSHDNNRLYMCDGAGGWFYADGTSASSINFKQNIEPLSYGIKELMQLEPVFFSYKESYNSDTSRQIGFIAEDTVGIIPEVGEDDGHGNLYTLKYANLTALLTKTVQDVVKVLDISSASTSSPALVVDSSGNVGIGTANPTARLDVNGVVKVGVSDSYRLNAPCDPEPGPGSIVYSAASKCFIGCGRDDADSSWVWMRLGDGPR